MRQALKVNVLWRPGQLRRPRRDLDRLSRRPAAARQDRGTCPYGRAGQPEEIAGAVAWLLSDDASYATGTVMRIAGGM